MEKTEHMQTMWLARSLAARRRRHEKWATEMRAYGWTVIEPARTPAK